jgi:hypothetical protein
MRFCVCQLKIGKSENIVVLEPMDTVRSDSIDAVEEEEELEKLVSINTSGHMC